MKVVTALMLAALVSTSAGLAPAKAQQCPAGTFPTVDSWGNQVCKRLSDQSTAMVQKPPGQACPNGAHPAVDNFGNQICRSEAMGSQPQTDYYDTSKGCPAGTIPWVDTFGNHVCKR
jgi:hypothetical protein